MNLKKSFAIIHKFITLTCIMLFCFAVATFGSGLAPISMLTESFNTSPGATPGVQGMNPWQAFLPLLLFSFVISMIFGYIILRSRWCGFKLIISIFFSFYGLMTIVGQLESLLFLSDQLPEGLITTLFVQGLIMAALFSPLAVLIMGKIKRTDHIEPGKHLNMPCMTWIWKLGVTGIIYVILYTIFGYFIAWKNPSVQAYYGGSDPGGFFMHLANTWQNAPGMYFFQFIRGLLWLLFVLPVIQMHKGGKLEVAITLALLFAFWSFQLLMPNPYMPAEVARVHLIETFSSNLIFGFVMGLIITND